MSDRKSQNERIRKHLERGKSIDPMLALRMFNCFRLSGRIFDLKAAGLNIVPTMVTKNGKRFAEYRLEKP